jgi:hypothetical protein
MHSFYYYKFFHGWLRKNEIIFGNISVREWMLHSKVVYLLDGLKLRLAKNLLKLITNGEIRGLHPSNVALK